MKNTRKILFSAALLSSGLTMAQTTTVEKLPNVIYIMADELGIGDLGCYGQRQIKTPNIDGIAQNGMKFMQHYSGSTVSAPSRCALITGKHMGHAAIRGNAKVAGSDGLLYETPLPAGEVTVADIFKTKNYVTGCVGKWGMGGPGTEGVPGKHGFDYFYGYLGQRFAHSYYPEFLHENEQKIMLDGKYYSHDLMLEKALNFIDENAQKPFFLYFSPTIPHADLDIMGEAMTEYEGEFCETPFGGSRDGYKSQQNPRAAYAAMVTYLDKSVGLIIKELKEKGSQTEAEWYTWGENYNNPDLKRYVGAMKNRYIIGNIKGGLSALKENPEFKLSECIYGKEDSKIRETYPILDWIKQYMEFKKDSEELKARQVKEAEEAERKAEEIENNVVENENVEEIENDVVENENSEKKEFKLVEGETTYDELITSMNDELENMDDIYWEETEINEKKLPEDILKISKNFEQIADNLYEEAGKKNKEIAEKEKAITEKENEVSTKMEEAKGLRDRLKEQHLYDNFHPQSPKNKIGKDGMFDKFKGDYSTFPEQVEGILKIYDDEIKAKEDNVAKLEPLYNADIEKAEQARKAYDAKKGTHKAEIINLDKRIEEVEILQRHGAKLGHYNQVKPLLDEFTNACKDTFSIKPNQEYKEKEMVDSIKQQAAEWLKIEGLHTGNHKNSIEYDRMITAFKMVAEYPTNATYADKFKGKELPISFDETLAFMKEQAENYKKAKDKQWRPLPSRLRNHRNTMAKFMIGFAERSMKGIAAQKELVELDYYIQTRGKSQGLDKDELIKDVMEAAGLKLPEREKTSTDKNMTTQKETTETQKENKELKAPEMEDDGMSMG